MDIIEIIAQDVFDKVRSRFSNLEMGDQDGNVTTNPKDARFFDFDFTIENNNLGRVSVSINDIGTLKVYYGQGITEDSDSVIKDMWYDFLKEMRFFAKRRMLRFDTRDIMKGNLNKDDFQYLATNGPEETNMTESQYFGSSKTSYRTLENTKLIIRHSKAVEEGQPGARSRHINALFIENADGERFKYPFIHLAGAKAMQRHVANGGRPYDEPGMAIIKMSESIGQLNMFKRHAQRTGFVNETTQDIVEAGFKKLEQLRQECINLSKQTYYKTWLENFQPSDEVSLDEVTLADYKDKFTVKQFEEDLTGVFPLLHAIMQETGTVDLEDLVSETTEDEATTESQRIEGFEDFETWAEGVDEPEDDEGEEWYDRHGNVDPNGAFDAGGHYHAERDAEDSMDNEEPQPRTGSLREIAEVVKSFYDRETGKFPKGETGVVTYIRKQFGDQAGQLAERLVAQLTHTQTEEADMDKIPAYIRKQKQQSQQTAQAAVDKKNQKAGAKVWSSPRTNEELSDITKLAGLAK